VTRAEAEAILDLIEERAPRLRSKGVVAVGLGEASFSLAPSEPAQPAEGAGTAAAAKPDEEEPGDVLNDPWTHGRPTRQSPAVIKAPQRRPL
jgi:hypothetical protein